MISGRIGWGSDGSNYWPHELGICKRCKAPAEGNCFTLEKFAINGELKKMLNGWMEAKMVICIAEVDLGCILESWLGKTESPQVLKLYFLHVKMSVYELKVNNQPVSPGGFWNKETLANIAVISTWGRDKSNSSRGYVMGAQFGMPIEPGCRVVG